MVPQSVLCREVFCIASLFGVSFNRSRGSGVKSHPLTLAYIILIKLEYHFGA